MAKANPFDRYVKADQPVKQRIIWAGFGEPGSGKTTFGLTAPGPIIIQSFDKGLEGVVEKYQDEKDIYVAEYDWNPAEGAERGQDEACDLRDKFIADFEHAITVARTVIWDKETDIFRLFKYAEFGFSEKGAPQDWDALKNRIRRLLNMPKALDINFGVIQGMKNEWVSKANNKTGNMGITQSGNRVRSGMDDVEALVHINIEHVFTPSGGFEMNIGKARGPGGSDVQGRSLPGLTFAEFAVLCFPGTDETDWM